MMLPGQAPCPHRHSSLIPEFYIYFKILKYYITKISNFNRLLVVGGLFIFSLLKRLAGAGLASHIPRGGRLQEIPEKIKTDPGQKERAKPARINSRTCRKSVHKRHAKFI